MLKRKTICLNMIVKNESHVIIRCLDSVKHLLDHWVIVDTGSTDDTQAIIQEHLKDIPGELHQRPWVNFGHNRNEALKLARGKADYILFIDADDRLVFTEPLLWDLSKDRYYVVQRVLNSKGQHMDHLVLLMIRDLPDFTWQGVLHESITSPFIESRSYEILSGVFNEYLNDGARSKDPDKLKNDIEMLQTAVQVEGPSQPLLFYLAQTYKSAKNYLAAIEYYKLAASMEGREDVSFYSLFSMGLWQEDIPLKLKTLSEAYLFRPSRIEPLFVIARHFLERENYFLAALVGRLALGTPLPPETDLFVETWLYEWGIKKQWNEACAGLKKSA